MLEKSPSSCFPPLHPPIDAELHVPLPKEVFHYEHANSLDTRRLLELNLRMEERWKDPRQVCPESFFGDINGYLYNILLALPCDRTLKVSLEATSGILGRKQFKLFQE